MLACVIIMGHDISGFKTNDTENEIAYLRRGAFNELKSTIYNALDCHECNGGVSGNGSEREFSKDELIKAFDFLGVDEDYEPERKFISDCLANVDENGNVLVGFY